MRILLWCCLLLGGILEHIQGQSLYLKTFGDKTNPVLIFLHGGPGYNAATFEATTAQRLADNGFFVIVYDRRGEGRSDDPKAAFSFEEANKDLTAIYKTYKIKQATLLGHSFGGMVATRFAEKNAKKVRAVCLIGAPVQLQRSFRHIRQTVTQLYEDKNDHVNLRYMIMLEQMDTASMEYASFCFMHAMQNGFYSTPNPTDEAKQLYETFKKDTLYSYSGQMSFLAPKGYWLNDHYTTLDLTASLQKVIEQKVPVYGLYGKDDGLYAPAQIAALQQLLGADKCLYLDQCSHSVFIDRQTTFVEMLKKWLQ